MSRVAVTHHKLSKREMCRRYVAFNTGNASSCYLLTFRTYGADYAMQ